MTQPSVCLFTTIREPFDETLAFAHYHLNIGVDHIYLFFDDPDDPALDALKGEHRITCTRCDTKHWESNSGGLHKQEININKRQGINSMIALEMARQADFTWICHIDGDELLYAPNGLKNSIAALSPDYQIAKASVLEVLPEKVLTRLAFQELCFFKVAPESLPRKNFFYLDKQDIFPFILSNVSYHLKKFRAGLGGNNIDFRDFFKGHRLGKSFVRTCLPIRTFYSHFPIPSVHRRLPINLLSDVKVLHYDVTDFAQWRRKWYGRYQEIRHKGIKTVYWGEGRKRQYSMFVKVLEQGEDGRLMDLFESTCLISPVERELLQQIGLISEIHLAHELFSPRDKDEGRNFPQ